MITISKSWILKDNNNDNNNNQYVWIFEQENNQQLVNHFQLIDSLRCQIHVNYSNQLRRKFLTIKLGDSRSI